MTKNLKSYHKLTNEQIIVFTKSIEALYNSGINIYEAIKLCDFNDPYLEKVKYILLKYIKNGLSFPKSLLESEVFPNIYIQWMNLAYETGNLSMCFKYLINFYENKIIIRNNIIKSIIYPTIVFVLTIITMFFMTIKIFPIFEEFIEEIPYNMWPMPTKIMSSISHFLRKEWLMLIILMILFTFAFVLTERSEYLNYKKNKELFKISFFRNNIIHRFERESSYILYLLLESGLSFQDAIKVLGTTHNNSFYKYKLKNIYLDLTKGLSPEAAFSKSNLVTNFFIKVLKNNILSGQVEKGLMQISSIRSLEHKYITEKKIKLIEPLLIIIAAFFIGFILLASVLPVLEITNYI